MKLPRIIVANYVSAPSLALLVFILSLFLFTRHNDFSLSYHPTEPSKVIQIRRDFRNFRHPLLLLTATDWAGKVINSPRTPHNIAVVGRWCSAVFASIAVVAFAFLGFQMRGPLAGVFAGLLL